MIKGISALELLHRETASTNRIKTLCGTLDKMLCGGIIIGKGIIELCGVPGSGKTLLCKILALNIQIPKSIGGPGLNAIYIDSEGGFSNNRLREISKSTLSYINERKEIEDITCENLIKNIKYMRIFDLEELINVLALLPSICMNNNIGIIIIDSISMLIRICNISKYYVYIVLNTSFLDNQPYRLKMQQKIAKTLENMSKEYSLSIIVTNHMTNKYFDDRKNKDQFSNITRKKNLEPSLGLSWNSLICERLILKREKDLKADSEALNTISVTNSFGEVAFFKVNYS
ncbi:Rad51 family protein [Cryptosporidium meleagridis]|uniref:DNA repair protein RAD51 homolog 3 n=1 Tax=Cryptosporidium meleagridis TaxID=93969 RepID=A0A2P4YX46_9CRYT|nr:Rad51 family protein [Cryptosporidium meleagridis]